MGDHERYRCGKDPDCKSDRFGSEAMRAKNWITRFGLVV